MPSHTLSLSCCGDRPCHGLIRDYGPSSVRCHHAGLQASAQTVLGAGNHRGSDEDCCGRSPGPAGRLSRRVGRIADHQPPLRCLSVRRYTHVAWRDHSRTSPRSSKSPTAGRGAWLKGRRVSHEQRLTWPLKFYVVIFSLTASKSASRHGTIAVPCKVAIPAKLLTSERYPRFDKSAIHASVLRQKRIKNRAPVWTFRLFTERTPLRLRILCFIMTRRLLNI